MLTYSTDTADLLFVGVPEGACVFRTAYGFGKYEGNTFRYMSGSNTIITPIPEGYSLLSAGTADQVSEDEAGRVVQWFELNGEIGYRKYESAYLSFPYKEARSSMNSLLRSLNLNPSETVVLFKIKN